MMEQQFLNTRDLAVMLGVSVKFIVKHRRRIPGGVKIGGAWRFRIVEIEKALLSGGLLPARQAA